MSKVGIYPPINQATATSERTPSFTDIGGMAGYCIFNGTVISTSTFNQIYQVNAPLTALSSGTSFTLNTQTQANCLLVGTLF